MQSRMFYPTSEKIAKSLKIDKDDMKKVYSSLYSSLSSKVFKNKDNSQKVEVTNSEEYCEMLKKEFPFLPPDDGVTKADDIKAEGIWLTGDESDDDDKVEMNNRNFPHYDRTKVNSGEVQSFVQKKNLAQGMMDLALVSANCNQLRYVLDMNNIHPYYYTCIALIMSSLLLQMFVGLILLYSNSHSLKRRSDMASATKCNNVSMYGVFMITITNFLISAFSGTNTHIDPSDKNEIAQENNGEIPDNHAAPYV